MSGGIACSCSEKRRPLQRRQWRVFQRLCNHSAFNGYRYTPSEWSAIICLRCHASWRTKGQYVASLPNLQEGEIGNAS